MIELMRASKSKRKIIKNIKTRYTRGQIKRLFSGNNINIEDRLYDISCHLTRCFRRKRIKKGDYCDCSSNSGLSRCMVVDLMIVSKSANIFLVYNK